MEKITIEVEKDALEMLDAYIHGIYSKRVFWLYQQKEPDNVPPELGEVWVELERAEDDAKWAKSLAKKFGLYPYNQEVVKYP
jgi:hypothetical protein